MKKSERFQVFLVLSFLDWIGVNAIAWAEGPALPGGTSIPSGSGAVSSAISSFNQPGGMLSMAPFVLMFGVLYFLVLRPQQKKVREQQGMIAALKHGDEIVTASGIFGKVTGITDKVVTVEVSDNVRVKMLKTQVSQVIKGPIKDLAL